MTIGDRNTVREFVTLNTGTVRDGVTTLGNDNWIMAYVHVAHDCHVGNNVILANSVQLGGHVHVGDWAIIGGLTGVHQFSRIGAHSMTGGNSSLMQDAPPFLLAAGNPAGRSASTSRACAAAASRPRRFPRCARPTRSSTAAACRWTKRAPS